jgi:hypothetical protein
MIKEKTKLFNKYDIEVNCINHNSRNVITTGLNLIHFLIFKIVKIRFKNKLHL